MEGMSQEEWVKKLEAKLGELREQRIKVDEANEILKKKLETLTAHLDDLDLKYGKKENDETTPKNTENKENEGGKAEINQNVKGVNEKDELSSSDRNINNTNKSDSTDTSA